MKQEEEKLKEKDPDHIEKLRLRGGAAILIFVLIVILTLPYFLTRPTFLGIDFSLSGPIGDTIGGIMGPFVAMVAAILTFMAFWVQYRANQIQIENYESQRIDLAKERFESRVYELLNMHRKNVDELEIKGKKGNIAKGRQVFPLLFREYKRAYHILSTYSRQNVEQYPEVGDINKLTEASWIVFFLGADTYNNEYTISILKNIYSSDTLITEILKIFKATRDDDEFNEDVEASEEEDYYDSYVVYNHFYGHSQMIGHYFRHLYTTVKYIANYDEDIVDENDKKDLLRTIRAQLSGYEQLLIYYNSLSSFGKKWNRNDFLTKYKMIKNIPLPLADFGIKPEEKFIKEIELLRQKDPPEELFEWHEIVNRTKKN